MKKYLTKKNIIAGIGVLAVVLIVVISFLYTSYEFKKIAEEKGSNVALNELDVFAATLSVISAIIVLYITANSPVEDSLNIENPNI